MGAHCAVSLEQPPVNGRMQLSARLLPDSAPVRLPGVFACHAQNAHDEPDKATAGTVL